ncbi:TIGR03564 family F420-dependent LLM class oxidoreductase [Mycolicibacterium austroafricanum]|uniref:TIGR03564 family F420-dependent LLM class oxidoreductase n=1 Tax=Mycolicibacterium austroafricanum TaxID=39687 RepID=A0ABT8HM87_MYCAO|nr:TIGR03564 family F420-dependent LLM class oxidoreductase [Mycolicibacterium austroafricanum]MDN4521874.1 TIGR03564 family F420-dependent LLM class oxidoreductase [Mycolicibacterium austroafricanum]QRZ05318.1 TIGR03564 family F420-dependent LLM class oxidoreductase [Mycolicibacterium austroafricanum]QZT66882.1 TIGR03564 family F420-dependent LLM class oxidoreductase [Mycolicibacterium austroafricanum]
MRIGLMVGSDRDRTRRDRLDGVITDGTAAEALGFSSFWFPQVPGYLDAMTALALLGASTTTIELGTAVVPIQTRHPMILAQQALTTNAACGGRFTLGLGLSHDWIINGQLGIPYQRPVRGFRDHLEVLTAAFDGPGQVDVDNDSFRVHSPVDVSDLSPPVLLAALGPTMLRIAGERTDGTILWMADERAIAEHVAPRITAAAHVAGRPAPRVVAGVPVAVCAPGDVDAAQRYASELLGHAHFSPNYVALLEHGDAADVGDTMAAGDESCVLNRLRAYRDAGVTDLAARIVPLGDDPASRRRSRERTAEFLASVVSEF